MPGPHLYEYAVIRVLPVLEREEFVNVGVVLFCKRPACIHIRTAVDDARLRAFHNDLDVEQVRENLRAFEQVARGEAEGGPIARFDVPSRFRWLTAVRSSAIQTSRPHPGLSDDLERTMDRLFSELVL